MKDTLLVTLADKNFIDQAKQLFSSVYFNAGWKGDYMLLAHEIPEKDLKWFRDKGILVKKCKPLYKKAVGKFGKFDRPPLVLDKFYLFTPEFKKWRNIVYLDADMIVRASLDKLTKLKGFWAVKDMDTKLKDHFVNIKKILYNGKELDIEKSAFNSGLMAFSTDVINKDSFVELIKLTKVNAEISSSDQSVFNLFFYNKWKSLPFIYNLFTLRIIAYYGVGFDKVKGVVLHFIGFNHSHAKCWDLKNSFYPEWKSNLDKAELIDLNNIPQGTKLSYLEMWDCFLLLLQILHIEFKRKRLYVYSRVNPSRIIGLIGQLIKKISPNLYYRLKKIK